MRPEANRGDSARLHFQLDPALPGLVGGGAAPQPAAHPQFPFPPPPGQHQGGGHFVQGLAQQLPPPLVQRQQDAQQAYRGLQLQPPPQHQQQHAQPHQHPTPASAWMYRHPPRQPTQPQGGLAPPPRNPVQPDRHVIDLTDDDSDEAPLTRPEKRARLDPTAATSATANTVSTTARGAAPGATTGTRILHPQVRTFDIPDFTSLQGAQATAKRRRDGGTDTATRLPRPDDRPSAWRTGDMRQANVQPDTQTARGPALRALDRLVERALASTGDEFTQAVNSLAIHFENDVELLNGVEGGREECLQYVHEALVTLTKLGADLEARAKAGTGTPDDFYRLRYQLANQNSSMNYLDRVEDALRARGTAKFLLNIPHIQKAKLEHVQANAAQ